MRKFFLVVATLVVCAFFVINLQSQEKDTKKEEKSSAVKTVVVKYPISPVASSDTKSFSSVETVEDRSGTLESDIVELKKNLAACEKKNEEIKEKINEPRLLPEFMENRVIQRVDAYLGDRAKMMDWGLAAITRP